MICKDCRDKHIARGMKEIICFKCGKITYINSVYSNVCNNCSDIYLICQYCDKEIKLEIPENIYIKDIKQNIYALSWLEIAIDNFKKQNEKVHTIEGNMTMDEFILEYAKEKLSKIIKC